MADIELLIRAFSSTHEDPVKDERGCYKIGDIVDVRELGFQWGASERLPKFYRVGITNTPYTVDEAKSILMKAHTEDVLNEKIFFKSQYNLGRFEMLRPPITLLSEWQEQRTMTISKVHWAAIQAAGKVSEILYFDGTPTETDLGEEVQLSGTTTKVRISGMLSTMMRRRLHGLRVADIPQTIKDQLAANEGRVTVTFAQVRNYVHNKVTDGAL